MDTVLVTGGAGFIGSCLVRMLISDTACKVVNLDKLTYAGNLESLSDAVNDPRHVFVNGDIGDRDLIAALLAEHRPDAVIHLAAESHVDRSIDEPAPFITTNVVGTYELLDATYEYWRTLADSSRSLFRFVHVSTDEVYGSLGSQGRFDERSPYAPNSPYSASKAASDHLARAYFRTYGLPVVITNSCNNFGPYQFPEKLVPTVIFNALTGKPVPIYGDGRQVRDWLYVEDHCHALLAACRLGAPGEVYLIGGDAERTNLSIAQELCDLVDELRLGLHHAPCRSLITHVADRPGHDRRYAVNSSKVRRECAWRPSESLSSALRRTVQWYLDHSSWIERVTSGAYRRDRLGLSRGTTRHAAEVRSNPQ